MLLTLVRGCAGVLLMDSIPGCLLNSVLIIYCLYFNEMKDNGVFV